MQGAQNSPRLDEDPVGPRHRVAGSPVGYKHGMRDGMRGRGEERRVARAAQQPLGNGKPRDEGIGPPRGGGSGERDTAWLPTNQSMEIFMSESAKQQPRGIGKPGAMEW